MPTMILKKKISNNIIIIGFSQCVIVSWINELCAPLYICSASLPLINRDGIHPQTSTIGRLIQIVLELQKLELKGRGFRLSHLNTLHVHMYI